MQTLSVDQLVGRTLGEYQVERLLGHGQLSAVYMAQQKPQGRTVMLTTFNFPDSIAVRERFAARFAQEGAALVRLKHPNILPTYDFGVQSNFPYLVTAFVKGASLSQVLKQQTRLTPRQTLDILKQLAAGLDYAHGKGVTHGILSLSNVLMSDELTVQIAGFGLKTLLEVHGNIQSKQPQAHLFSESGTFLGSPEYIAPERVLGMPTDARSDIYALGIMLFELLSGTQPFRGATPLETALKRIQQPVPSLHSASPEVSEALDLVITKALERDPERRYQRAGDIAGAFDRVLTVLEAAARTPATKPQERGQDPQITLPPTVNWFDEDVLPSGKWQLIPPIVTGRLPAVLPPFASENTVRGETGSWQEKPSPAPDQITAAQSGDAATILPKREVQPSQASGKDDSLVGIDPFAWWSATSAKMPSPTPGTFTQQRPPVRLASTKRRTRPHPAQQDRRRLVTLIATGGAVAGVLAVGGISFAHFAQSMKLAQTQIANVPTSGPTTTQGKIPTPGATKSTQNTPTPARTPAPKPSPTKAAQPSPTVQPTQPPPTPTQPPPTPTQLHQRRRQHRRRIRVR